MLKGVPTYGEYGMSRLNSILGKAKWHAAITFSLVLTCSSSWVMAETGIGASERGAEIYRNQCLRCHGEKLDGHGPASQYLKNYPTDLQTLSSTMKSDWELLTIVSYGVLFSPMHSYRDVLSEQDIQDIVAYIRTDFPFRPLRPLSR